MLAGRSLVKPLVVITSVVLSGIVVGAQNPPAPPARFPLPMGPWTFQTSQQKIAVSVVARGFANPFSLLILPDGDMLVGERGSGKIRAIRKGVLDPKPLTGVPAVRGYYHAGLLDLAVHPQFAENKLLYFSYSKPVGERNDFAIVLARGRYDGDGLSQVQDLYVGDTSTNAGGSRIAFGADGTLYMTTSGTLITPPVAQDGNNSFGKVLRFRDDGTVPADNPFVGRAGYRPEVFSLGHRDHYGLAIQPTTGAVFEAELGPLGGDKINIILPGRNYGWPLYGYGRQNDSTPMEHPYRDGIEPALITWQPGITPSGLIFYTGDRFPEWKGNLIVGMIQRGRIAGSGGMERVVFNGKMWELRRETMLTELHQRVRDIRQGPDGLIYLLTDEADGAVLKIEPAS
jgi:glucose/arabinose dehydrogenase